MPPESGNRAGNYCWYICSKSSVVLLSYRDVGFFDSFWCRNDHLLVKDGLKMKEIQSLIRPEGVYFCNEEL